MPERRRLKGLSVVIYPGGEEGSDYILVYNYHMSIHCHFAGPGADCQARQMRSLCPLVFKERKSAW